MAWSVTAARTLPGRGHAPRSGRTSGTAPSAPRPLSRPAASTRAVDPGVTCPMMRTSDPVHATRPPRVHPVDEPGTPGTQNRQPRSGQATEQLAVRQRAKARPAVSMAQPPARLRDKMAVPSRRRAAMKEATPARRSAASAPSPDRVPPALKLPAEGEVTAPEASTEPRR